MRRLAASRAAAGALAVALVGPAGAHAQTPDECVKVLEIVAPGAPAGANPCQSLAVALATLSPAANAAFQRATDPAEINPATAFSQREMQAHYAQHPALAGSAAQPEAVADVQPAAAAAGSIAALGTEAGNHAVAALALNPAIFLLSEAASREFARLSRFADISVLVPVTSDDETEDESIDYVGVRLRLNYHGLSAGDRLWEGAREILQRWIGDAARRTNRVRELLSSAPDLELCAIALRQESDAERVEAACGGSVDFGVTSADVEALREQFIALRRAVDSRYFGADIGVDFGDPTLGATPDAAGTYLFAGVAAGRSLPFASSDLGGLGVRGRLGVRHASLDAAGAGGQLQLDGGAGVELSRMVASEELSAAGGIEFRYGGADEGVHAPLRTDFVLLRGSLIVPVTGGASMSIATGVPLGGDISSFLSVNFNWGLLLPGRQAPL